MMGLMPLPGDEELRVHFNTWGHNEKPTVRNPEEGSPHILTMLHLILDV